MTLKYHTGQSVVTFTRSIFFTNPFTHSPSLTQLHIVARAERGGSILGQACLGGRDRPERRERGSHRQPHKNQNHHLMKVAAELCAKPTATASLRSTRTYFLSQLIKKPEEQGELTNQALCGSQGARRRREQSQISSLVSNAAVDKLLLRTVT